MLCGSYSGCGASSSVSTGSCSGLSLSQIARAYNRNGGKKTAYVSGGESSFANITGSCSSSIILDFRRYR